MKTNESIIFYFNFYKLMRTGIFLFVRLFVFTINMFTLSSEGPRWWVVSVEGSLLDTIVSPHN